VVSDHNADLQFIHWWLYTRKRGDGSARKYAATWINGTTIYLHQIVVKRMGLKLRPGEMIDHKDRDGLNCQDDNLRVASHQMNQANSSKRGGTSKFRGVSYYKKSGKWRARSRIGDGKGEGKLTHLGYFDSEIEAAKAYNNAALKHFGPYANLNVIPEDVIDEDTLESMSALQALGL
jgi:hypothetical protein